LLKKRSVHFKKGVGLKRHMGRSLYECKGEGNSPRLGVGFQRKRLEGVNSFLVQDVKGEKAFLILIKGGDGEGDGIFLHEGKRKKGTHYLG